MLTKWSDWLLAAWVVFVAVVYYGGSSGAFGGAPDAPPISVWIAGHTEVLSAVYAAMLLISVLSAVFAAMRKSPPPKTQ